MGIFRDDFYSTKVGRGSWKGIRGRRTSWPLRLTTAVGCMLVGGMIVAVAMLPGDVEKAVPAVVTVQAPKEASSFQEGYTDDRVIRAVEKVERAVVTVRNGSLTEDGFEEYGMGSGIIFEREDGKAMIVTNNHVIESGESVEIVLSNGDRKQAEVIGQDALTDIAVLETDDEGIEQIAEFGDSTALKAGQTAIAIGNPLGLGYSHTITVGVISSPLRSIEVGGSLNGAADALIDVIQTDAAINSGNSGGALVDLSGRVIGMNSMKIAEAGVEGLGFALPIHDVVPIIDSLIEDGRVIRPLMGIRSEDLMYFMETDRLELPDSVNTGVVVIEAIGPADRAGLEPDDVIVELDGKPVGNMLELRRILYKTKQPGDRLDVTYYRLGKKDTVTVVLDEVVDP